MLCLLLFRAARLVCITNKNNSTKDINTNTVSNKIKSPDHNDSGLLVLQRILIILVFIALKGMQNYDLLFFANMTNVSLSNLK